MRELGGGSGPLRSITPCSTVEWSDRTMHDRTLTKLGRHVQYTQGAEGNSVGESGDERELASL